MIQFVSVSKYYKDIAALENISFSINENDYVFLTGPSGSGKTTLIKLLIREEVPSAGKIFVGNEEINRMRRGKIFKLRRKIGVVFQDFKLIEDKNAYENVAFALEASGKSDKEIREIVPYVLDIVGLSNRMDFFPRELSGGQKQKVAIARAIANDPEILIADEPTGNLDEESKWDIVEILHKINEWGTTVITATHDIDVIDKSKKRTVYMENGIIVKDTASEKEQTEFESKILEEHDNKEPKKGKEKKEKIKVNSEKESEKSTKKETPKDKESEERKPEEDDKPEDTEAKEKIEEELQKINEELEDLNESPQTDEANQKPETKNKKPHLKFNLKKSKSLKKDTSNSEDSSAEFEDHNLSNSTIKLLKKNNYNNVDDVINAGFDKIEMIENIKGDQLKEIEKLFDNDKNN